MVWTDKLGSDATSEERRVFESLDDPRWGWRTVPGIADSTGIDPLVVRGILLKHKDLIRTSVSSKFGPIYQLIERKEPPEERFTDKFWDYMSMGRRRIA
jgi:hypothetical protein